MSLNSTEHSAHNSSSIVTHLRDLLPIPRHAIFHVKLVIHQLLSVPLISGEFRINWKFRHIQAVNSAGRPLGLGRALALKLEGQKKKQPEGAGIKGKNKEVAQEEEDYVRGGGSTQQDDNATAQPALDDDRPESTHSGSKQSISSNSNSNLQADTPPSEDPGIEYSVDARGHTPFLPLRDFKVDFESEINVAVQMSIDRESYALLPSELKLTVMQHVIPGDPEAPVNPRLGHVQLNLAEYANAGPVTRNYLLRRSKVNAMLNMTITMSQISGEENYRAPPLRKEEIKAGISEFLNTSDVPLPVLSRYIVTDDPWVVSSLSEFTQNHHHLMVDEPEGLLDVPSEAPEQARPKKRWRIVGNGKRSASAGRNKTLDSPPRLSAANSTPPRKQQLHPTEALIEAIFNPYPSTSGAPSPFTYYVPPEPDPKPDGHGSNASEGNGTDGTGRGSFDSSRRTSASEQGHEGGSSGGSGSGSRWWKRKVSSRPGTPARMDSTRS